MTRREKLLQKLHKMPPPRDFTWEELLRLMRQKNFTESCAGGSHYLFRHASGYPLRLSKTHPSGLLKQYQIEAVKAALRRIGERENE